ncbi:oxygenase MpaB family protein [Rhodococcus aerolatus]
MPTFTVRGQRFGGLPRDHWARANAELDPETDFVEIYRNLAAREFPWDTTQALSFALFRTYAVPGIGRLLDETGEFTTRVQKRYDDTVLLLEPPFHLGFADPQARAAIRRVNRMHRSYAIPDHEMRYVLATFVVVPQRWLAEHGPRPLTEGETRASVQYYRTLGAHLGIPDVPETFAGFAELMDGYEAEHFGYTPGGRRVADATLGLMTTFYPRVAAPGVRLLSRALMDPPLRDALGYAAPPAPVERALRAAVRARGRLLRLFPTRVTPVRAADSHRVRSYPDGADVEEMGTFPVPGRAGCPVPHA